MNGKREKGSTAEELALVSNGTSVLSAFTDSDEPVCCSHVTLAGV
jgi:hypothetical protein